MKLLWTALLGLGLTLIIQSALKKEISPYHPHPAPGYTPPYSVNDDLARTCKMVANTEHLDGPETVAYVRSRDGKGDVGAVYAGTVDGMLWRLDLDFEGAAPVPVAFVGGRPLGMVAIEAEEEMDKEGSSVVSEVVYVADVEKGLIRVDVALSAKNTAPGIVSVLARSVTPGSPRDEIVYADDVDLCRKTGKIYFSDASTIRPWRKDDGSLDTMGASVEEAVTAKHSGSILVYDPATRGVSVLARGLYFANGVAVAHDGSYVLVSETFAARILKIPTTGPSKGVASVWVDDLPGYPDGISITPDGKRAWIAVASPRSALLERIHPYRFLKALLSLIPQSWIPKPVRHGLVVEVDLATSSVLRSLHDPSDSVIGMVTAVEESPSGSSLLLGTLHGHGIVQCHSQATTTE